MVNDSLTGPEIGWSICFQCEAGGAKRMVTGNIHPGHEARLPITVTIFVGRKHATAKRGPVGWRG